VPDNDASVPTVWSHLSLRRLIPLAFVFVLGLIVTYYKEHGEMAWFPDWGFDVVLLVFVLPGIYWLWTRPDVQSAARLAYDQNSKMLALFLIVGGMFLGGAVGAFGFWRIKRYQESHTYKHFESHYTAVAPNVPDHVFSFYASPTSICGISGTKKVTFSARIGFSTYDSMRRLVIDLPPFCEFEAAQYALEHRHEIIDRITTDMKKTDPDLLDVPLNGTVILQHRHPLDWRQHARIARAGGESGQDVLVEGPLLPGQ